MTTTSPIVASPWTARSTTNATAPANPAANTIHPLPLSSPATTPARDVRRPIRSASSAWRASSSSAAPKTRSSFAGAAVAVMANSLLARRMSSARLSSTRAR